MKNSDFDPSEFPQSGDEFPEQEDPRDIQKREDEEKGRLVRRIKSISSMSDDEISISFPTISSMEQFLLECDTLSVKGDFSYLDDDEEDDDEDEEELDPEQKRRLREIKAEKGKNDLKKNAKRKK